MVQPVETSEQKQLTQVVRYVSVGLMDEVFEEVCAQGGTAITESQFQALRYVDRHRGATVGDLAEALGISSAAATKAARGLCEDRQPPLVRRRRGTDRREVRLETTAAGARLVALVRDVYSRRLEAIFGRMSDLDRRAMARGLEGFLKAALQRPCDCDAACLRCGVDHSDECLVYLTTVALGAAEAANC